MISLTQRAERLEIFCLDLFHIDSLDTVRTQICRTIFDKAVSRPPPKRRTTTRNSGAADTDGRCGRTCEGQRIRHEDGISASQSSYNVASGLLSTSWPGPDERPRPCQVLSTVTRGCVAFHGRAI